MEARLQPYIDLLISRYPKLKLMEEQIIAAYDILEECCALDRKLLIAGNDGSAANSEHMACLPSSVSALADLGTYFWESALPKATGIM